MASMLLADKKTNCSCTTGGGGLTTPCAEAGKGTILPNCFPLDSILKAVNYTEDPSVQACNKLGADMYPVLLTDPACGKCVGNGMVAVACKSSGSNTNNTLVTQCCQDPNSPGCADLCPKSAACDGILGGYGVAEATDRLGADDGGAGGVAFLPITMDKSSGEAVCGFHPITGEAIPSCPLMTAMTNNGSATKLTPVWAQNWCDCNPEACNSAMRSFCSGKGMVGNPWMCGFDENGNAVKCPNGPQDLVACMCWNPGDKPWGSLRYGDLTSITAFQGSTWPLQCLWPPCRDQSGTVLARRETDAISCPSVQDVCLNIIQDVRLENVSANNITLGECIQAASGSNLQTFSPKQWLEDNPWIWISGLAILGVILVVLLMVAFRGNGALGRFSRKRAFLAAQKEQTLWANRMASALKQSANPEAKALGNAIDIKRRAQLKALEAATKARQAKLKKEQQELMKDAATNLAHAKKLAHLTAKADAVKARDADLKMWYTESLN